MTQPDTPYRERSRQLEAMKPWFARLFEQKPAWNSALLAVAQYWADEANDAVHCRLVVSRRPTPRWPLPEDAETWGPREHLEPRADELHSLWDMRDTLGDLAWDDNSGAVRPFQAFCDEGGSQELASRDAYTPVILARRNWGDVELSLIGDVLRPWLDLPTAPLPSWVVESEDDDVPGQPVEPIILGGDDLSRLERIAGALEDEGLRQVWADTLQQRADPRGHFIALSVSQPRSEVAEAERRALLEQHGEAWLGRLNRVVPLSTADLSTGVLTRATTCFDEGTVDLTGDPLWQTVTTLRFAANTEQVLSPAMRRLRNLEGVRLDGLAQLQEWPGRVALEGLHVHLQDGAEPRLLASLGRLMLPALRHFTLSGRWRAAWHDWLPLLPFWDQLTELTLLGGPPGSASDVAALPRVDSVLAAGLPRDLTRVHLGAVSSGWLPAGWRFSYEPADPERISLSCGALGLSSSDEARDALLSSLPASVTAIDVVPSLVWTPDEAELRLLSAHTRKRVAVS